MTIALLFAAMLVLGMGNGAVFQLVPQRFRRDLGVVTGILGSVGGTGPMGAWIDGETRWTT